MLRHLATLHQGLRLRVRPPHASPPPDRRCRPHRRLLHQLLRHTLRSQGRAPGGLDACSGSPCHADVRDSAHRELLDGEQGGAGVAAVDQEPDG